LPQTDVAKGFESDSLRDFGQKSLASDSNLISVCMLEPLDVQIFVMVYIFPSRVILLIQQINKLLEGFI